LLPPSPVLKNNYPMTKECGTKQNTARQLLQARYNQSRGTSLKGNTQTKLRSDSANVTSSVDCKLNCSELAASHAPPPSPRIQLSHVIVYASRHYVTTETALGDYIFRSALLLTDHENLHQDHCSSICNALMMITGVIKTFPICR